MVVTEIEIKKAAINNAAFRFNFKPLQILCNIWRHRRCL